MLRSRSLVAKTHEVYCKSASFLNQQKNHHNIIIIVVASIFTPRAWARGKVIDRVIVVVVVVVVVISRKIAISRDLGT